MNDLTLEDFKQALLDIYVLQRENALLRAQLSIRNAGEEDPEKDNTEA